jgi:hypothetical protein
LQGDLGKLPVSKDTDLKDHSLKATKTIEEVDEHARMPSLADDTSEFSRKRKRFRQKESMGAEDTSSGPSKYKEINDENSHNSEQPPLESRLLTVRDMKVPKSVFANKDSKKFLKTSAAAANIVPINKKTLGAKARPNSKERSESINTRRKSKPKKSKEKSPGSKEHKFQNLNPQLTFREGFALPAAPVCTVSYGYVPPNNLSQRASKREKSKEQHGYLSSNLLPIQTSTHLRVRDELSIPRDLNKENIRTEPTLNKELDGHQPAAYVAAELKHPKKKSRSKSGGSNKVSKQSTAQAVLVHQEAVKKVFGQKSQSVFDDRFNEKKVTTKGTKAAEATQAKTLANVFRAGDLLGIDSSSLLAMLSKNRGKGKGSMDEGVAEEAKSGGKSRSRSRGDKDCIEGSTKTGKNRQRKLVRSVEQPYERARTQSTA